MELLLAAAGDLPDGERLRVGREDEGPHQEGAVRRRVCRRGHFKRRGRGEGQEIR